MSDVSIPAQFDPPDSEGFRTVSFYGNEGSKVLKLSLHLERLREEFTRTASDLAHYSDNERDGLRTAAVIAAARKESSIHDPGIALATMLDLLIPKFVSEQTEKLFPELARIALQAVQDACIKFAVSGVVEMNRAPRIYGEETAEWILRDLTATIRKEFLRIKAGRPSEVRKHLEETREAVGRLVTKGVLRIADRPTQEQVAEEIGVDARSMRDWLTACDLSWEEWITASQWQNVEKGHISDEWLAACRHLESGGN
jgi:hypothetical protein